MKASENPRLEPESNLGEELVGWSWLIGIAIGIRLAESNVLAIEQITPGNHDVAIHS